MWKGRLIWTTCNCKLPLCKDLDDDFRYIMQLDNTNSYALEKSARCCVWPSKLCLWNLKVYISIYLLEWNGSYHVDPVVWVAVSLLFVVSCCCSLLEIQCAKEVEILSWLNSHQQIHPAMSVPISLAPVDRRLIGRSEELKISFSAPCFCLSMHVSSSSNILPNIL